MFFSKTILALAIFSLIFFPTKIIFATEIIEESIVLGINKEATLLIPDWREKAQRTIDEVNRVFAKSTKKQFKYGKILVYEDSEYTRIFTNPSQYPEFFSKYNGKGGITHLLLVTESGTSNQQLKDKYGSDMVNVMLPVNYQSQNHYFILQQLPSDWLKNNNPNNSFMVIHELGHIHGVAIPDWYLFEYTDLTGVEPKFLDYSFNNDRYFDDDPMSHKVKPAADLKFSELSSAIINRNIDHGNDFAYVKDNWYSKVNKVKVVGSDGKPVKGAAVKVYNVLRGCWFCTGESDPGSFTHGVTPNPSPAQEGVTDASGEFIFNGPKGDWVHSEQKDVPTNFYLSKGIKVYHNGLSAAASVNFIELVKNYILKDSNVFTLTLRLGTVQQAIKLHPVKIKKVSDTQAVFKWKANQKVSSVVVEYGVSSEMGVTDRKVLTVKKPVDGGEVVLKKLSPSSMYFLTVKAVSTSGSYAERSLFFDTKAKKSTKK